MNTAIHPAHARAAAEICRRTDPELFYISQFLPKALRRDALILFAVIRQVYDIFNTEEETGGCCSSDSIEQRVRVAHSVMDYLFAGETTGKDELDGFGEMAQRREIGRDLFDHAIAGIGELYATPRFATWDRLRSVLDATAGSWALLTATIFGSELNELQKAQVKSIGIGMQLTRMLCDPAGLTIDDHIPLPLDDLLPLKITERKWRDWIKNRSTSDNAQARVLLQIEIERARNLLTGGAKALPALRESGADKAIALLITMTDIRLTQLQKPGVDPFRKPVAISFWQRFKAAADATALLRNV